jgi:hypothetical protein
MVRKKTVTADAPKDATGVPNGNGSSLKDLLKELWEAAVNLRGSIEPADYKRYVLPIIFLRFLSPRYERRRAGLEALIADPTSSHHTTNAKHAAAILNSPDEYQAGGAFIVPEEARWARIVEAARKDDIRLHLDNVLELLEKGLPGPTPRAAAINPLRRRGERIRPALGGLGRASRPRTWSPPRDRAQRLFVPRQPRRLCPPERHFRSRLRGGAFNPSLLFRASARSGRVLLQQCGAGGLQARRTASQRQPGSPACQGQSSSTPNLLRRIVAARGFGDESIRDVVLLLVEEVGELDLQSLSRAITYFVRMMGNGGPGSRSRRFRDARPIGNPLFPGRCLRV